MRVAEIFQEVSKQMHADFRKAQRALAHSGLKGTSNEDIVRAFLRTYLPKTVELATGQIVDSVSEEPSRQQDVIIYDMAKTPVFYKSEQIRVIPVECVYSIIEVKAFLDKERLEQAFENMRSVRALRKKAHYEETIIKRRHFLYGEWQDVWPVNYFVFAFDSIDLATLNLYLHELHSKHASSVTSRIDSICVLRRGVILNRNKLGMVDALPTKDSQLSPVETEDSLLLFYALISNYLNQATMPNFRFKDYLGSLEFGPTPFSVIGTGDKVKCGRWVGIVKGIGPMTSEFGSIYTVECDPPDSWLTPEQKAQMGKIEIRVPGDVLTVLEPSPAKERALKAFRELSNQSHSQK